MFDNSRKKYVAELTEYYGRLGLTYTGDGVSQQAVTGPYQGYWVAAEGSREFAGRDIEGSGPDANTTQVRTWYQDYLQVGFRTAPVSTVVIFHRQEYATAGRWDHADPADGKDHRGGGSFGFDVLRHSRLNFAGHLDTSAVPEFAAEFIVSADDHEFARKLLPPEVLSWIARDARSARLRLAFGESAIVTFRSGLTQDKVNPDSLFQPKWIFPAADFLVELFQRIPDGVLHPMTAGGGA